jgi:4-amino-4-deoxy-L-arabinose transferase-like glycosyltransferase
VQDTQAIPAGPRTGLPQLRQSTRARLRQIASCDRNVIIGLILLAVAVRVLFVVLLTPSPTDEGRFDDTVWYHETANTLLDGDGYRDPYRGNNTAKWPIGYPLTLAAIYAVPGPDVAMAKAVNVVLGAATVVLLFVLGRAMFNRAAGIAGAAIAAVLPGIAIYAPLVMTETYSTFWVVLGFTLYTLWLVKREPRTWQLLVTGLVLGWATIIRAELLILPVIFIVSLFLRDLDVRRAIRYAVPMAVGVLVFVLPWTVRNAIQLETFVVGTTHVGSAVWQGHNQYSNGGATLFVEILAEEEGRDRGFSGEELEVFEDDYSFEQAWDYIKEHPEREFGLTWRRFYYTFGNDTAGVFWTNHHQGSMNAEQADWMAGILNGTWFMLLGVAAVSVAGWFSLRDPARSAPLFMVAFWALAYSVVFLGNARYHYQLMPIFCLWAGLTIVLAVRGLQAARDQRDW